MRFGNRQAFFPQAVQMKRDRVLHLSFNFLLCATCRNAARKVWRVRGITGRRLFDHDQVFHCFNPACFKTLFRVPGARSSLGLSGTVTSPGFDACLNCRCEPRWRTTDQPSSSSILTTSRIFTIARAASPFYRAIPAPFWTIKTAQICGAKARNDAFPTAPLRRIDLARKQRHREPWRERPLNRRRATSRGANRGRSRHGSSLIVNRNRCSGGTERRPAYCAALARKSLTSQRMSGPSTTSERSRSTSTQDDRSSR